MEIETTGEGVTVKERSQRTDYPSIADALDDVLYQFEKEVDGGDSSVAKLLRSYADSIDGRD